MQDISNLIDRKLETSKETELLVSEEQPVPASPQPASPNQKDLETKIDDSIQANSKAIVRLENKLGMLDVDVMAAKVTASIEQKMTENHQLLLSRLASCNAFLRS